MKKFATNTGLLALAYVMSMPLVAGDATTALFERLYKGDCVPSSLTGVVWTITTAPVGTHGELNWGDQLFFEQVKSSDSFDQLGAFNVWKNEVEWTSASGWLGACVRNENLAIYVVTGTVELDGCLHELAFGRLDHDDGLSDRIEVVFEHVDGEAVCSGDDGVEMSHPGHAHGDHD